MTYKVAYNACFGGFSLSKKAVQRAKQLLGTNEKWGEVDDDYGFVYGIERHDPLLIQVIEEMGEEASGSCAKVRIAEIETNTYRIDEYDGMESVETKDDIDWTVIR